jgi:hypothetical protein
MDRKVFSMGLSVESTSAYLLCCALADAARTISSRNLLAVWNGSPETLRESLEALERRRIIRRILDDGEGADVYRLCDPAGWLGA